MNSSLCAPGGIAITVAASAFVVGGIALGEEAGVLVLALGAWGAVMRMEVVEGRCERVRMWR